MNIMTDIQFQTHFHGNPISVCGKCRWVKFSSTEFHENVLDLSQVQSSLALIMTPNYHFKTLNFKEINLFPIDVFFFFFFF